MGKGCCPVAMNCGGTHSNDWPAVPTIKSKVKRETGDKDSKVKVVTDLLFLFLFKL